MTYWVNTSGNDLIKDLIARADSNTKAELELLFTDAPVTKTIDEAFTFAGINQTGTALWSLLLFSGYLTYIKRELIRGKYECLLALPNYEIKELYRDFITEIFHTAFINSTNIQEFFKALISGQTILVHELLQMFIVNHMSTFDLAVSQPEISYHMFVLGLLVAFEGEYSVRSNRESGYGRYDVMLIPHDKSKTSVVIEFKTARKQTLDQAVDDAILQIQNKQYAAELRAQGIVNIIGYGIAFCGKEIFVKSIKL